MLRMRLRPSPVLVMPPQVLPLKRQGEDILKNSGLGYTIVRSGLLYDEPGGAKALVFDQGGRINQVIHAARASVYGAVLS